MSKPRQLALSLLLALFVSPAGGAEPLTVGDPLPPLELEDQYEQVHRTGPDTRFLLFAPDQDSGEIARDALKGLTAADLAKRGVLYTADISGMPGFITTMFALPKMRDYGFPVLLGREAAETALLPRREGEVTVLELEAGTVKRVWFAAAPAELAPLLD
jgi:hypothetical protein